MPWHAPLSNFSLPPKLTTQWQRWNMKFTEYLFFAAMLMPTAAVLMAAALSIVTPAAGTPNEVVAQYGELENQP
jgi:hypothetical protein